MSIVVQVLQFGCIFKIYFEISFIDDIRVHFSLFQVLINFFLYHLFKRKHVGITVVSTDASLKEPSTVRFLNQCNFCSLPEIIKDTTLFKGLKGIKQEPRGKPPPWGMALIALDSGSQVAQLEKQLAVLPSCNVNEPHNDRTTRQPQWYDGGTFTLGITREMSNWT